MKREKTIALALVLILAISALTTTALAASAESGTDTETTTGETQTTHRHSSKPSGKQQTAEPEGAIGKDAARTKALEDAGVTADQVTKLKSRVTKLDDGTVIYKVSFTYDGQKHSYQINALTGDVIDKSTAAATESGSSSGTRKSSASGKQKTKTAEPEGAIGKDAAKTKALEDAGVTADQVTRLKSRVTKLDDGTVIYKVKFTYDGQRYSYQIDALTGDVIDKSSAAATDSEASSRGRDASGGTQETSEAEATV